MSRLVTGRRALAGVVIVGVLVASGLAASQLGKPDYRATPLLGRVAPDVVVTTMDGEEVALRDLAGRAVVVNFWNTWCVPCRREIPALETFWARHSRDTDIVFVGIVRDDTEDAVREFVEERRWDWTIAMDHGDRAALAFGTTGQPETFAIAPDGLVVGRRVGEASVDDLERLLAMARGQA
jgi:cytochrome c biogenesis protein CcmG/thiol:disulfide interchange protein DsbE